jgi:hypothetical protein
VLLACTSSPLMPMICRFGLLMESQSSCIFYTYFFSFLYIFMYFSFLYIFMYFFPLYVFYLQVLKFCLPLILVCWSGFQLYFYLTLDVFISRFFFWTLCILSSSFLHFLCYLYVVYLFFCIFLDFWCLYPFWVNLVVFVPWAFKKI